MSEPLEALTRLGPSRKENVKRIRVDVAHPMTQNFSSSCPWGKLTGDDLQHAFIIE
jgi:hypothetical protein